MISLTVNASKTYPITITRGWDHLPISVFSGKKVCFVTDCNVAALYLEPVKGLMQEASKVVSYQIAAGEGSKNAENYFKILNFLAEEAFTRQDAIVALGGGVVGDLTGFVASTYMRGIAYYQIPTTLLAMIDSSVGGKTAIDLSTGKNLVGTFYQPSGVYINLNVLSTLKEEELQNGMGELVKYAFLSKTIEKQELFASVSERLIAKCLEIKRNIVQEDEREGGVRKLLNLGHTVGHAIETLSYYTIPHGVCVAKGMAAAISLSEKYYGLSAEKVQEMQEMLASTKVNLTIPYEREAIISAMLHDKKASGSSVDFILIKEIGDCRVQPLTFQQIEELL